MSHLFTPLQLRDLTLRNRIVVSPMCMYSSNDGLPTDWHLVHLGSRAVGGAGMVILEATAVSPEGRITPHDSGIWSDAHANAFQRITHFIREAGAAPAIQLAHAGRKASTDAPWRGGKPLTPAQGAWPPLAPSAMTPADIDTLVQQFTAAANRALAAGFEALELHAAHGYLLHEFLSPLSNHRTDDYGGSLANRMRLPLRIAQSVRHTWPARLPLLVRLSVTDWTDGGWDLPQSIELAKALKRIGVDMIDCSSGALVPRAKMPIGPGYQVPFAEAIRRDAAIPTGAVGMIADPQQAEEIIATGKADAVLLARQLLRDPYWPLHAATALGEKPTWPKQYERAG
jgi:2,4-dienoyl-CoA reductase-like NADH-dependent reductase (Old Yellow Enzyme family)